MSPWGTVAFVLRAAERRDFSHDGRSPFRPDDPAAVRVRRLPLPPDVIVLAVRWYLRFGLSYRDVEELLAERGVEVDHVTVYRWVVRFTPLLAEAARPCRHQVGGRWFVDETYVRVAGRWSLRLPRHRSVRAGHRRVCLAPTRHHGSSPVLRARHRHDQGHTQRGCVRPGVDVPDGAR